MRRPILSILVLTLSAGAAHAAPRVTVYGGDLGFVVESRVVDAGDTLRLGGLPERTDASSIRLAPESGRVTLLAWRHDAAGGDGLLERSRGRRVRVTSRGDRAVEGVLEAADGNWLVVRGDDGRISTLARTAVEDVRLTEPPPGLAFRPTLEALIEDARGRRVETELSYLTGGLGWSAEHVIVRQGDESATWSAAAIVRNETGVDFAEAAIDLVAGEPRRAGPMPPPMVGDGRMLLEVSAARNQSLAEQVFSEYHIYTLDRPATLRHGETRRLSMLEPRPVRVTPRYVYRAGAPGVASQLEVVNTTARGLGVPLPAGRVRFYERDASGRTHFTGESSIRHTPEGETVTLDVGTAFDLAAERREVESRRISDREREVRIEVKLRNRKPTPVTIVVEEPVASDHEVVRRSHPFTRKDAGTLRFELPVPAGREVVLDYTVRARY